MTESEQVLLQKWDEFFAAQSAYFDARIIEFVGHPHVPNAENVAFIQVDDQLARPAVEKAVIDFIHDGAWSNLGYRECLNLLFRIRVARKLIAVVLGGTAQGSAIEPALPDLVDRAGAVRFFLVDLWNLGGKPFLAALAGEWLKRQGEGAD